jgi:hypothetical protein
MTETSALPHKHLWRLEDADGATIVCDLDTIPVKRHLLTVTKNGETLVTESFADKRDALARSVALYKELTPVKSGKVKK